MEWGGGEDPRNEYTNDQPSLNLITVSLAPLPSLCTLKTA